MTKLNSSVGRREGTHPAPFIFVKRKYNYAKNQIYFEIILLFWKKTYHCLLLNEKQLRFKSELLYYVSLLSNYFVIDSLFFEKPLPCQNKNWGYNNFSSTFDQNECKYFHYIFFFLSTSRIFLECRPFLPQESLVVKKKPDGIVHIAIPI